MKSFKIDNSKYLVANAMDELWGMYCTTIGFQSIGKDSDYPPKKHPSSYWFNPNSGRILHEYQLLYIVNGEGIFESSHSKPTKIVAGDILILFPEVWHTYKPIKQSGWDEYWFGFKGAAIDRLIKNSFFSAKSPILNIGYNEQVVSFFKQGIETATRQKTAYQQLLSGIAGLMLSFIYYSVKNNSFRDKEIISQIDKAKMMMMSSNDINVQPERIAKELHISYSWFRRVFKQYTGFSPAQYQMKIKLEKSKELLTSTNLPVKEISFELNFESVSYFVTFFKARTGLSPTGYRNKVHGK